MDQIHGGNPRRGQFYLGSWQVWRSHKWVDLWVECWVRNWVVGICERDGRPLIISG